MQWLSPQEQREEQEPEQEQEQQQVMKKPAKLLAIADLPNQEEGEEEQKNKFFYGWHAETKLAWRCRVG